MHDLQLQQIALQRPEHGAALLSLLDHYARDPMGGGQALPEPARRGLIAGLSRRTDYVGWLAFALPDGSSTDDAAPRAVGLLNAFEGYSTFAAKPLLNIHDLVVHRDSRGRGIGRALLQAAQDEAAARGCCKLTLEVLSRNETALAAYRRFGFAAYELDAAAGQALFLEKKLPGLTA
jgi:GNAT superfamily N-acetyltransferase